jgi:hypothetical protein
VTTHYSEDDLTLYYYGEGRRRDAIERHVEECPACKALYREIAGTLAMIAAPEAPERGDQYGLEVWQRIRQRLPEQESGFARFSGFSGFWGFSRSWGVSGFGLAAAAALLLVAAFVGGRAWQRATTPDTRTAANVANPASPANVANPVNPANRENPENRILLTSVADHLDRSARILSDIMNASGRGDISIEQGWAQDLLDGSRLYRQDAVDAGEQSVASVLDELERSLLEIVHSPSRISAADLERIRRRIDAAALLFKVRVMSDELRQREQPATRSLPRSSTTQKVS